jgi:hypothetical protein
MREVAAIAVNLRVKDLDLVPVPVCQNVSKVIILTHQILDQAWRRCFFTRKCHQNAQKQRFRIQRGLVFDYFYKSNIASPLIN